MLNVGTITIFLSDTLKYKGMVIQNTPRGIGVQLNALIADLNVGVITLLADGTVHSANQAALDIHQVPTQRELGETAAAYEKRFELLNLTDDPVPGEAYPLTRLLRGEAFDDLTYKIKLADDVRVVEMRGILVPDEQGELDFYTLFLDDETERFDAEERFERAFAANPAPSLLSRLADERFIKVDSGFLKMTGFSEEEILGRTLTDFDIIGSDTARAGFLELYRDWKTIYPIETTVTNSAGGKKWVIMGGQPMEVGNDRCMMLTFTDIDEHKRVLEALRKSEERFAKIFELGPVAAMLSGLENHRIIDVNDSFKKLTGYNKLEVIGKTPAHLGLWNRENEQAMRNLLREKLEFKDKEFRISTQSNTVCDVLISAAAIHIGEQRCVLTMFYDITSWKRTESELVEAVNLVMQDTNWFSSEVAKKLLAVRGNTPSQETVTKLARLTPREMQVLELLYEGKSTAAIAKELAVAINTVRNYIAGLYRKLGVHSRTDLLTWVKKHNALL